LDGIQFNCCEELPYSPLPHLVVGEGRVRVLVRFKELIRRPRAQQGYFSVQT
jgi:hypothetical protein